MPARACVMDDAMQPSNVAARAFLAKPLVIAGDAIFAGSMGGGMVSYAEALDTGRTGLMTLPEETVVCPGHGPLTTIGEEKRHNPFFSK